MSPHQSPHFFSVFKCMFQLLFFFFLWSQYSIDAPPRLSVTSAREDPDYAPRTMTLQLRRSSNHDCEDEWCCIDPFPPSLITEASASNIGFQQHNSNYAPRYSLPTSTAVTGPRRDRVQSESTAIESDENRVASNKRAFQTREEIREEVAGWWQRATSSPIMQPIASDDGVDTGDVY